MKKILLSSVALLGLTVGAMAADLPVRRMAPAPIIAVPVFTWTGFYVGVNAGVGFGTNSNDHNYAYNPFFPTFGYGYGHGNDDNDTAFIGGAQAGFNFQTGMFVFGVEADIQYAGFGNSNKNNGLYNPFFYGYGYGHNDDGNDGYFGTVRARVGVAFDRLLVFATGGLAYGDIGNSNNNHAFGGFGGFNPLFPAFGAGYGYDDGDNNDIGYAVGGGIEYAITNNFTVKVEGLYVNLGDDNNNRGYGFNPLFPFAGYGNGGKNNAEFGVVRAGLNYKF